MEYNRINELKEQIEKLENELIELKIELAEKQGYTTLDELSIEY